MKWEIEIELHEFITVLIFTGRHQKNAEDKKYHSAKHEALKAYDF